VSCPETFAGDQGRLTVSVHRQESVRKFETEGGLVSGTEESRGRISIDRPNRQWGKSRIGGPESLGIALLISTRPGQITLTDGLLIKS
jgi:hypothetical protein